MARPSPRLQPWWRPPFRKAVRRQDRPSRIDGQEQNGTERVRHRRETLSWLTQYDRHSLPADPTSCDPAQPALNVAQW